MKQNNIKSKIALGIILIISIILCAIYIQFNHQNVNTKYSDIIINNEKLNIFYFNVGQADCTLITINNKNMLIDIGQDSDGEYIIEFLKEKDINNLDYLVITHGDIDHSGGAKDIIGHIKIENIFMPQGIIECEEEYKEIKKLAIQNKIKMPKVEINQ